MTTDTAELVKRAKLAFAGFSGLGKDIINEMISAIERHETERLTEYLRGQMDMRERSAKASLNCGEYPSYIGAFWNSVKVECADAIRALPIEGETK
jgi:hypothetical protein